jgi:hypothetical protein
MLAQSLGVEWALIPKLEHGCEDVAVEDLRPEEPAGRWRTPTKWQQHILIDFPGIGEGERGRVEWLHIFVLPTMIKVTLNLGHEELSRSLLGSVEDSHSSVVRINIDIADVSLEIAYRCTIGGLGLKRLGAGGCGLPNR